MGERDRDDDGVKTLSITFNSCSIEKYAISVSGQVRYPRTAHK